MKRSQMTETLSTSKEVPKTRLALEEKYKYMLGQAHAYQLINQEISNLLKNDKEQDEQGNVIDIGKGSTKN